MVTLCPDCKRFFTIPDPMLPNPMNPNFKLDAAIPLSNKDFDIVLMSTGVVS